MKPIKPIWVATAIWVPEYIVAMVSIGKDKPVVEKALDEIDLEEVRVTRPPEVRLVYDIAGDLADINRQLADQGILGSLNKEIAAGIATMFLRKIYENKI